MNIKRFIESLDLQLNVTERFNCPVCNNYNTFAVTRKIGGTYWFCFHNSCRSKGKLKGTIGKAEIVEYFYDTEKYTPEYSPPETWFDPIRVASILGKHNILDVYQDRRIQVGWDNKRERYVFMIWSNGKCFGGIGRSFSNRPKWLLYKSYPKQNKFPLVVPKHGTYYSPYYPKDIFKVGVIVEDAISAAAVSHVHDGVAILGTHIPDNYVPLLSSYDNLFIALDEDATNKAIKYQQFLNVFVPTKIIMLDKDLKDMSKEQILEKVKL